MQSKKTPSRKSQLRVTKTLDPDQPGAIKLAQKYGDALLCVRYRQDALGLTRDTTVELIVDQAKIAPKSQREVGIRIAYSEEELRARARGAGATWDKAARLWRMPLSVAHGLGLLERVAERSTKKRLVVPTN